MIRFYSIAYNRPEFIALQVATLARFVPNDHQLVIINNGRGGDREAIFTTCRGLGLTCRAVHEPRYDLAGESHIRAMAYALETFIREDTDISVIIDHDIFPFAEFNVAAFMQDHDMAGLAQGTGHVRYFWPGLVIIKTSQREDFTLHGGAVDDIQCDVGAQSAVYLRNHPDIRPRWLTTTGAITSRSHAYLPAGFEGYEDDFEMEIIEGVWLHHREGSKWERKSEELYQRKAAWTRRFLEARV